MYIIFNKTLRDIYLLTLFYYLILLFNLLYVIYIGIKIFFNLCKNKIKLLMLIIENKIFLFLFFFTYVILKYKKTFIIFLL